MDDRTPVTIVVRDDGLRPVAAHTDTRSLASARIANEVERLIDMGLTSLRVEVTEAEVDPDG